MKITILVSQLTSFVQQLHVYSIQGDVRCREVNVELRQRGGQASDITARVKGHR